MKKVLKVFLILLFSITIVNAKTYSRKELQDLVLSTALSYLNNNEYSDYEQLSLATGSKFAWTNFNVSPEGMSRSRYITTSCAAFTATCYNYSLGFYFKEYSNLATNSLYKNGKVSYDELFYDIGYGATSTSIFSTLGKKYKNDSGSIVVYYHEVQLDKKRNYVETPAQIKSELDKIKKIFQPGDILIARRTTIDSTSEKGHAMLYVGNLVDSKEPGFIHSSGSDLIFKNDDGSEKNPITIGDDTAGILYSKYSLIEAGQLYPYPIGDGKEKRTSVITILRPINQFCGTSDTNCNVTTINSNAEARHSFRNLKIEQYITEKNGTTSKIVGYDYNSINYYDNITYNLLLTYKGNAYSGISIKAPIPKNSTFVSCNNCTHDNDYAYWNNITINDSNKEALFKLTVRNKNEKEIVFNGFKITGSKTLSMDKLITKVNPTLNSINGDKLKDNYKNYSGTTQLKYISNVYKGIYGIDISYLTFDNIKSSIFENNKRRKTSDSLSGNKKLIDQMLVPGFYGGTKVELNTRKDRIRYVENTLLEVGDILVTYKGSRNNAYLFLGILKYNNKYCATYVNIDSNKKITLYDCDSITNTNGTIKKPSGYRLLKEVHSNDFFVLLRPSRVYGSTIVYNYNGATTIQTNNIFAYKTYGELYTPKKTNYTFGGWYKENNFSNKIKNSTSLSNDKKVYNVYAKWISNNIDYSVKHWKQKLNGNANIKDSNNYDLVKTEVLNAKENTSVTPSRKTFTGFTSPNGQTIKISKTGNQVVNYYYTRNKYNLSLKAGTGIKSVSGGGLYLYGANVTINAVVKDGYTFKNWTDGNDIVSSKKQYMFTRKADNRTFTANAKPNTYTITFDKQKGTNGTSIAKVTYDASLTGITIPERSGYKFLGYTDANSVKYYDANGTALKKYDIVGDTTLYASWQANTYTVVYNANGGKGTVSNSSHTYGVKKALNENKFTRDGYNFLGWSKDSTAKKATHSDKQEVTGLTTNDKEIVTLYAIWAPKNDIKYTVIHYKQNIANEEYFVNEREYLSGTANTNVTPDVKSYTGFDTPSKKTVKIAADGSTTVKYYYKRRSSTVNLVKGTGIKSISGAGTYKYWDLFTIEAEVEKGYTFVNWTNSDTNNVLTKQQKATYNRGPENRTFKANARPNKYVITYNGNGASGTMDSSEYTYDSKGNLRENTFVRDNYTFLGWSSSKEGDVVEYQNGQEILNLSSEDNDIITLYALWGEKEETPQSETKTEEVIIDLPETPSEPTIEKIEYEESTGEEEISNVSNYSDVEQTVIFEDSTDEEDDYSDYTEHKYVPDVDISDDEINNNFELYALIGIAIILLSIVSVIIFKHKKRME